MVILQMRKLRLKKVKYIEMVMQLGVQAWDMNPVWIMLFSLALYTSKHKIWAQKHSFQRTEMTATFLTHSIKSSSCNCLVIVIVLFTSFNVLLTSLQLKVVPSSTGGFPEDSAHAASPFQSKAMITSLSVSCQVLLFNLFFYLWLTLPIRLYALVGGENHTWVPFCEPPVLPPKISGAVLNPQKMLTKYKLNSSLINYFLALYNLGTTIICVTYCGNVTSFIKYDVFGCMRFKLTLLYSRILY